MNYHIKEKMYYKFGFNKCVVTLLSYSVIVSSTSSPGINTCLWGDLNFTGALWTVTNGTKRIGSNNKQSVQVQH